MAPSIVESPAAEIIVPVKTDPGATDFKIKPRVRRIIDEEGEGTTASVN
jgi:taurine dioxygenase/sulfonate dioxygenase